MLHFVTVANANNRSKSQDEFFDCLHDDVDLATGKAQDESSEKEIATKGQKRRYDSECGQVDADKYGDIRDCLLYESCIQMHRRIPSSFLMEWIANVKSYLFSLSGGGGQSGQGGQDIHIGCSCSGTGIWGRVNEMLLKHWQGQYDVGPYVWRHRFMCEINPRKQARCVLARSVCDVCSIHKNKMNETKQMQAFLLSQFDPDFLFDDVRTLADQPTKDVTSGRMERMPPVKKYGSGFSCKDLRF